ncbi:MAG: hypothetical protein AABZ74_14260 [Cyanobacteriota bacterium]
MKKQSKIFSLSILFLVLSSSLYSCTNSSTIDASKNQSNALSSNSELSLGFDDNFAFSSIYENEGIFVDSEIIANQKENFNTKALLDAVPLTMPVTTSLNGITSIVVNLKATIDVSADILSSIGRTDFDVKTSTVLSAKNADGSTKNSIELEYKNKETGTVKNETLSKTYLKNNDIEIVHNLRVNFNGYTKTSTRIKTVKNNELTTQTQSKTTLSNGTTIDIIESRNKNNSLDGSGTIEIKSSNGKSKMYAIDTNVNAMGKLSINAKDKEKNIDIKITDKTKYTATTIVTSNGVSKTSEIKTDISSESSLK